MIHIFTRDSVMRGKYDSYIHLTVIPVGSYDSYAFILTVMLMVKYDGI